MHEREVFKSRGCDADTRNELKEKGYAVIRGKISRKYFEERFYGMTEAV